MQRQYTWLDWIETLLMPLQNIRLTRWHDIRPKDRNVCFDVSSSVDKAPVVLFDWSVKIISFFFLLLSVFDQISTPLVKLEQNVEHEISWFDHIHQISKI